MSSSFYHHFLALSLTTFITLIPGLLCNSQYDPFYTKCSQPFKCGDTSVVGQLKYPFWGINRPSYCGISEPGLEVKCINNKPIITVSLADRHITVDNLNIQQTHLQLIATDTQDHTITVVSADFSNTLCPPSLFNNKSFTNLSMEKYFINFHMDISVTYLTILYGCPSDLRSQLKWSGQDSCTVGNAKVEVHFTTLAVNQSLASDCLSNFTLPIHDESARALENGSISLREALNKGFELDYFELVDSNCDYCLSSGGQCGHNFTCYCPDKPYPVQCPIYKQTKPDEQPYDNCKKPFECGNPSVIGDLRFPFWGLNRASYCGKPGFEIYCVNNTPIIPNPPYNFQVIGTNPQDKMVTVSIANFSHSLCYTTATNLSIYDLFTDSLHIYPTNNYSLLTLLYNCRYEMVREIWSDVYFCNTNTSLDVHFLTGSVNSSISSKCSSVVLLPILQDSVQTLNDDPSTLPSVLSQGFETKWTTMQDKKCQSCMRSGGECGFDWSKDKFTCYCPHNSQSCLGGKHKTMHLIVVSVGAVVALLSILGGCLLVNQKSNQNLQNQSVEDSLRICASLVPKRYAYKYIKKVTKSFREKLGEGGYGTVYKGSLKDGRVVAVKVWKQSKGDGQDFLNEVMSISRTSHINVVPLLGFCFEGHKRALIYEFMPNGSLEKFLKGRYFSENDYLLSTQKLFEVGVGVARGLEYLHRGCNTRIVHFDIKPHNILLDAEFIPKISDFGLAKSCQQKESLISMSEARGTIGYIAPEVFFRTYGGVSDKSDVYSFGMMILEMVGCKNKVHENAENSSEMYFPQWIYKQLEQGTISINCERILNEEETELERKMILVGLWCIQTNPLNRPSMNRVVEMLEGKVLLDVPPMPTLCTPPLQQLTDKDSASFLSSTTDAPTL